MNSIFEVCGRSGVHFGRVEELLPDLLPQGRVIVVEDRRLRELYPSLCTEYNTILIDGGEAGKTLQTIEQICRQLINLGADRSTFLLAIGGGITTDVAGFAASIYMRGLKFGFISTTVLGQVDASVGGKNGVNLDGYKNMVGTFTQPQFVICDTHLLKTLSNREFRAGLAELVKSAIIADSALFEELEATTFEALRSDEQLLEHFIAAAVGIKSAIVSRDEREAGERRKLNLGHTLGHAIEKCSSRMNHGEAVAVGMRLIADVGVKLGVLPSTDRDRILRLLENLGFQLMPPAPIVQLLEASTKDKKNKDGDFRIILPFKIGACEVRQMTHQDFFALFTE